MTILIKNGNVFIEGKFEEVDVLIDGEFISEIGNDLDYGADKIIDGKDKLVIPGGIDVHTHFTLEVGGFTAADDFYSGSKAAAFGGTTSIVDHIGFFNKDDSLNSMIDKYHERARDNSIIDYSFHGAIENTSPSHLNEFESLIERGITSIKLYTTYDGRLNDQEILKVLEKAKETGMTVAVHAENHGAINELREKARKEGKTSPKYHPLTRPAECEGEAINRIIYLSEIAGCPKVYFVHVTSQLGMGEIVNGKKRGVENIFAETCSQYLVLDDSEYSKNGPVEGTKYIMAPPLRKKSDQDFLWQAIDDGYIDVIATDHCPFNFQEEKSIYADNFLDAPGGAPGVEERIEVVLTEGLKRGISIEKLLNVLIERPARIYGLYPQKGVIKKNSDADIVLIDRKTYEIREENRHSNVDYTPYEGFVSNFKVDTVISRGEIIIDKGVFNSKDARGKFIERTI